MRHVLVKARASAIDLKVRLALRVAAIAAACLLAVAAYAIFDSDREPCGEIVRGELVQSSADGLGRVQRTRKRGVYEQAEPDQRDPDDAEEPAGRNIGRDDSRCSERDVSAAAAKRARVMLVDDHAIVREGYRSLLQRQERLEVVAEAGDGAEAYRVY